jgi:hypothetical protein
MAKKTIFKRAKKEYQRFRQRDESLYKKALARKRTGRGAICRPEDLPIYAPVTSFLPSEQLSWIALVNRQDWTNKAYQEASKHMLDLLNRYLDALKKDRGDRQKEFEQIAEEITAHLRPRTARDRQMNFTLAAHAAFTPAADPTNTPAADPTNPSQSLQARPFLLATPGGLAGYYLSLARFLAGEHAHRLNKCLYCRGLFIAPDNRRHAHCPGTDHKDRHWQRVRGKSGYYG